MIPGVVGVINVAVVGGWLLLVVVGCGWWFAVLFLLFVASSFGCCFSVSLVLVVVASVRLLVASLWQNLPVMVTKASTVVKACDFTRLSV